MRKPLIAVLAALTLAAALPSVATAATVKGAVKVGAKCSKSGAKAKIGSTNVICKRNAKKVLVWTKVKPESAACKEAKADYAAKLKLVADIEKQVAELKAKAVTDADKSAVALLESQVPLLKPLVDQLASVTADVCALS